MRLAIKAEKIAVMKNIKKKRELYHTLEGKGCFLPKIRTIDYVYLRAVELGKARKFDKKEIQEFYVKNGINSSSVRLSKLYSRPEIIMRLQAIADQNDKANGTTNQPFLFGSLVPDKEFLAALAFWIDPFNTSETMAVNPTDDFTNAVNCSSTEYKKRRVAALGWLYSNGMSVSKGPVSETASNIISLAIKSRSAKRKLLAAESRYRSLKRQLKTAQQRHDASVEELTNTVVKAHGASIRLAEFNICTQQSVTEEEVKKNILAAFSDDDPLLVKATLAAPDLCSRGRNLKIIATCLKKRGSPYGETELIDALSSSATKQRKLFASP